MEFFSELSNIDSLCQLSKTIVEENSFDKLSSSKNELELIELISTLFLIYTDKSKRLFYNNTLLVINSIINHVNCWATPFIADILIEVIKKSQRAQKEYAYLALKSLIETYPEQIRISMPNLIHVIASDIHDINKDIKKNASDVLELLLKCSGNSDLDVFIPDVLKGIKDPKIIYNSVEALASCVFVQIVEAPALAITLPIIQRGLNDKVTATKRLTCIIIDNMCKLIEHPKEILPFYEKLKSLLERCNETISNPEARAVSNRALNTLKGVVSGNENVNFLKETNDFVKLLPNISEEKLKYISILITNISNSYCFNKDVWNNTFNEYLPDIDDNTIDEIYKYYKSSFEIKEDIFEDVEEGKDLYKGSFSLAYGALTLLNKTHLHLKQNRFYGLLGPNNCGKTTLMRAISNEQV